MPSACRSTLSVPRSTLSVSRSMPSACRSTLSVPRSMPSATFAKISIGMMRVCAILSRSHAVILRRSRRISTKKPRHSEAKPKNLHEFYGILHYIQSVTSLSYKRDRCISFSLYVSQILWICVTVLPKIISTRVSGEVSDTLICCKRDRYMGFHIYVSRFKQIL